MSNTRKWRNGTGAALVLFAAAVSLQGQQANAKARPQPHAPALEPAPAPRLPIDTYIRDAWKTLQRSISSCTSLVDPKVQATPVLYLPKDYPEPAAVARLKAKCGVDVERLPAVVQRIGQPVPVRAEGLLFLPHPYVVPGGRFNEMYGWDSYFILLGLLRDGHADLARGIVENFFFEIEHYGGVLNANRTYYFSRSQPPFLSSMIRAVYEGEVAAGQKPQAHAWLGRAYRYAVRDHALWLRPEHRAGDTGLSRYFDYGEGPVPEEGDDPTYYQNVIHWLLDHPDVHTDFLVNGPEEPTEADNAKLTEISCDPAKSGVCAHAHVGGHWLTKDFYKGDRAMRESGFDPAFRYGPFSGATHHFAPDCLNSLLYKYERDLAWMAEQLGKPAEAERWRAEATARRAAIDKYLWNPAKGMYFDYDFVDGKASTYNYITIFYPLWAGAASPEQARLTEAKLSLFEHRGGLAMSTDDTGVQWDLPYGWAPVNWLAVAGLREYGDVRDAARVSREFSATVRNNFICDSTIHEKYNMVTGSSTVEVATGYRQNVVGFGWTNGVYLEMQALLRHAGITVHPAAATPCADRRPQEAQR